MAPEADMNTADAPSAAKDDNSVDALEGEARSVTHETAEERHSRLLRRSMRMSFKAAAASSLAPSAAPPPAAAPPEIETAPNICSPAPAPAAPEAHWKSLSMGFALSAKMSAYGAKPAVDIEGVDVLVAVLMLHCACLLCMRCRPSSTGQQPAERMLPSLCGRVYWHAHTAVLTQPYSHISWMPCSRRARAAFDYSIRNLLPVSVLRVRLRCVQSL